MSTMRTMAVAVVAVLLAADTPPGCAAAGDAEGPPSCFMRVSRAPAVYQRTSAADVEIRGAVAVRCNPTPRRHLITIWLSQEFPADSDVWLPRGDAKRSDRLPDAHGFDVVVTLDGCIPGRWRMQARAQGTSADGTVWGPVDLPQQLSPVRTLECPGPRER